MPFGLNTCYWVSKIQNQAGPSPLTLNMALKYMAWGNCIPTTTGGEGSFKCAHSALDIKEVWLKELWITGLDNSRLSKSSFFERLSWRYDSNIGGNKVSDSGRNQDVKSLKNSLTLNNFAYVPHNFLKPFMRFIKNKALENWELM